MDVVTVGADAPREDAAAHPRLLPHQLAALRALRDVERGCDSLEMPGTDDIVRTRMGVFGDKAGSGKSYVVSELALRSDRVVGPTQRTRNVTPDVAVAHRVREDAAVDVTVVVVPHNLVTQWTRVLLHMAGGDASLFWVANKTRQVPEMRGALLGVASGESAARVILVSTTVLHGLMAVLRGDGLRVARMVFDEADGIRALSAFGAQRVARFFWFVTASPQNLFSGPAVEGRVTVAHSDFPVTHSVPYHQRPRSALVGEFFRTQYRGVGAVFARVTVVTDNAFVDASFDLQPPEEHRVACAPPLHTHVLRGSVSGLVMERLHAGDVGAALSYLRPDQAGAESNVVAAALRHLNVSLQNAQAQAEFVRRRAYPTPELGEAAAERAAARVAECEGRVQRVTERIRDATACPICYGEMANKTVLPCCSNSFCLSCIAAWVASRGRHATCPMCKAPTSADAFMVCCDEADAPRRGGGGTDADDAAAAAAREYVAGGVSFDRGADKAANLERLLAAIAGDGGRGRRVLFFSDSEYANERVAEPAMRAVGMAFAAVKGNAAVINKRVRDFAAPGGAPRALLINCTHYGCGLDLSAATDVILFHKVQDRMDHQIVGRAQRPPRSSRLRVWRLVNEGGEGGGGDEGDRGEGDAHY
jgi:hypothetical protein